MLQENAEENNDGIDEGRNEENDDFNNGLGAVKDKTDKGSAIKQVVPSACKRLTKSLKSRSNDSDDKLLENFNFEEHGEFKSFPLLTKKEQERD